MVYWLARDPVAEVEQAVTDLAVLGKPVMPVGQAYDAGPEGGPPGPPPKEHLVRFIQAAQTRGVDHVLVLGLAPRHARPLGRHPGGPQLSIRSAVRPTPAAAGLVALLALLRLHRRA